QPLVARLRRHAPPSAKLPLVRPRHQSQTAKLLPLIHQRTPLERHDPSQGSCQKCPPCLRTPVHHVSGPYTLAGGKGWALLPAGWGGAPAAKSSRRGVGIGSKSPLIRPARCGAPSPARG